MSLFKRNSNLETVNQKISKIRKKIETNCSNNEQQLKEELVKLLEIKQKIEAGEINKINF